MFDAPRLNDMSSLLQMLEICIHSPGSASYHPADGSSRPIKLGSGEVLIAGTHDLVRLIALPARFEQVLEQETNREGRGKLLVSGKRENF